MTERRLAPHREGACSTDRLPVSSPPPESRQPASVAGERAAHRRGPACWTSPEPQSAPGSSVSSHSRQIQSPSCPSPALSAMGTIVTPHAGQIGGLSSSTPRVWSEDEDQPFAVSTSSPRQVAPSRTGVMDTDLTVAKALGWLRSGNASDLNGVCLRPQWRDATSPSLCRGMGTSERRCRTCRSGVVGGAPIWRGRSQCRGGAEMDGSAPKVWGTTAAAVAAAGLLLALSACGESTDSAGSTSTETVAKHAGGLAKATNLKVVNRSGRDMVIDLCHDGSASGSGPSKTASSIK